MLNVKIDKADPADLIARTKELIDFARIQGYRPDELIKIEDLGRSYLSRGAGSFPRSPHRDRVRSRG